MTDNKTQMVARRAELIAELFLQDLRPTSIAQSTAADMGYDFLVGFDNAQQGRNTFAVQVRATARPIGNHFRIPRLTFKRLAHSNIPSLLLVVDVKHNRIYYAWLTPQTRASPAGSLVSIPVVEINEARKAQLRQELTSGKPLAAGMAVAR